MNALNITSAKLHGIITRAAFLAIALGMASCKPAAPGPAPVVEPNLYSTVVEAPPLAISFTMVYLVRTPDHIEIMLETRVHNRSAEEVTIKGMDLKLVDQRGNELPILEQPVTAEGTAASAIKPSTNEWIRLKTRITLEQLQNGPYYVQLNGKRKMFKDMKPYPEDKLPAPYNLRGRGFNGVDWQNPDYMVLVLPSN